MHVGIDFGTSNSAVAVITPDGETDFLSFSLLGETTQSYRSLLFFNPEDQEVQLPIQFSAGVDAIEAYLDAMGDGRLVQSFKTHLTTASLGRTQIGHHAISLDDMVVLFFRRLAAQVERHCGQRPTRATLGRPVRFAGAKDDESNARAASRLQEAASRAGFTELRFELEPIAAAFHYEQRLDAPELALVADFGGGTTDYCIMRLGPDSTGARREDDIVGTGGVAVAGDDLDATIIERVICPHLGQGSDYVEFGRRRGIPNSYFYKLARWHQLSFLRGRRVRAELERLHQHADRPEAIEGLIHVIENNQGFHLHKAVERLKISLSSEPDAVFRYADGPIDITQAVRREEFEQWIAPHVDAIADALDDTVASSGLTPAKIDRVFMTGGTAFVPAVRRAFESRFGKEKLAGGDELMSIASGLARHGARVWS